LRRRRAHSSVQTRRRRSGRIPEVRPLLHDLGSCEVKHGVRVSVVNLYDDQFGNAKLPQRFETAQKRRVRLRWAATAAALLALAPSRCGYRNGFPLSRRIDTGCTGEKHRGASV
jgi:hypothetical protein